METDRIGVGEAGAPEGSPLLGRRVERQQARIHRDKGTDSTDDLFPGDGGIGGQQGIAFEDAKPSGLTEQAMAEHLPGVVKHHDVSGQ